MAEIQFERRGFPLWKAVLILLGLGGAAFGGYQVMHHDAGLAPPAARPVDERPAPAPATAAPGATPATAPATAPTAVPAPPGGAR